MKMEIGISGRHVHLSEEDFKILFGEDYKLTKLRDLKQPGEFAAVEQVTIKTAKDKIDKVRIIGPLRAYTQVEISKTDAHFLGLNPPVRNSGDLGGSAPITIMTAKGMVNKDSGCIIATRHLHLTPVLAEQYQLKTGELIKVRLFGEKGGIIDNVHVRVSAKAYNEIHLDFDDANAHLLNNGEWGELIKDE